METEGQEVGFLVVGAGFLGAQRAAAVMAARGCRLIAVLDCNEDAAQGVARQHGVRVFDDYAAGLACNEVDAVVIATPHADHFEQARLAIEAGKHVLCEKPLAILADQARQLCLLADERGVRLATGLNHRFYPPIQDALALADSGAIGRLESVQAEIGHMASADFLKSWHTDVSRSGGGTLMDNGPHACDLVRRFLGQVLAAQGTLQQSHDLPEGCESEANARFFHQGGSIGEVRSSWRLASGYLTLDVRGTGGHLHVETAPWKLSGTLENGRRIRKYYLAERVAERRFRGLFGCERSLVREIESFLAHPLTRTTRLGATGWDGCRVTEMIDAVYRSAASGTEVLLEPMVEPFQAVLELSREEHR